MKNKVQSGMASISECFFAAALMLVEHKGAKTWAMEKRGELVETAGRFLEEKGDSCPPWRFAMYISFTYGQRKEDLDFCQ
jgi:hypothetical protein